MFLKFAITIICVLLTALSGGCYSDEQLADIEMNRYGQTFEDDSLSSRLIRLENDLFGMTQSGDIDTRLDMISQMASVSKNPAMLADNDTFYPGVKQNPVKRVWNSISSGFTGGSMTGFTPSVNSYGYSSSNYGNGLWNFFNGANSYCPYHNTYHNGFFNNHNFPMGYRPNFNNGYFPHNHNLGHIPHNHIRPAYNTPYGFYHNPVPTNYSSDVITGSSVHILKD